MLSGKAGCQSTGRALAARLRPGLNRGGGAGKKLSMTRSMPLLALALAHLACSRPAAPTPPATPTPPGPAPWSEARALKVAVSSPAPGRTERLELRHLPEGGPERARVQLVLVLPEGEEVLSDARVPLAVRDAAWAARWMLVPEPAPGQRRAISWDGGASYASVMRLPNGELWLCPHKTMPSVNTLPDWPKMLNPERWAPGVLETAVWGCDEAGRCKASSQANMTVHHSDPEKDFLVASQEAELHAVLAVVESLPMDRFLGAGLVDATLSYRKGASAEELEKLGRLAARALGPDGPFGEEERKAMRLRAQLGRDEAKKAPEDQLSPRRSIEAFFAGEEPVTVPGPRGR